MDERSTASGSLFGEAGLRYVRDDRPGISRVRRGRSFSYHGADGATLRDPALLARIRALAIPPAWTQVWICADPRGHIQATGRDAKGRKQYRYHPRWSAVRNTTKFERLAAFGEALPQLRARVEADLGRHTLCREKVLATVVRLLETTLIRVGNLEYARSNDSFGLTTLRSHHVDVQGGRIDFHFKGKSGKRLEVTWRDRRLARVVRRCQELPGQELFQYFDEHGEPSSVDSDDVNTYLREATQQDFTAKDFRTWTGTVETVNALRRLHAEHPERIKGNVVEAIREVSELLLNTPAVCRKYYIHPDVLAAYEDGSLLREVPQPDTPAEAPAGLRPDEAAVLGFLRRRAAARHKPAA